MNGPGAKVRMYKHKQLDSFCIEIARKNHKPFSDHIISVVIPKNIMPINLEGTDDILTDAWIITADGRRRNV